MPFDINDSKDLRKSIPSTKNLSTLQCRVFTRFYNKLESNGVSEKTSVTKANELAEEIEKSLNDIEKQRGRRKRRRARKDESVSKYASFDIEKNTFQDRFRILSDLIREQYPSEDSDCYCWSYTYLEDFDDEYAYFTVDDMLMRVGYTIVGEGNINLADEAEEVVRVTEFLPLEENNENDVERSLLTKFINLLNKNFNGIPVTKQFEDELMIAIEPLYVAPEETDGVGDTMDLENIISMVESINKSAEEGKLQSGLFHKHKTDSFSFVKAWVNPCECMIGETNVPEGQPIAKIQFHNEDAWNLRKSGQLMGLSIGAKAKGIEEISKNLDELKSSPVAKRKLIGVHFDFDGAELTYTDASQGGACSLKNDPFLLKANEEIQPLTNNQKHLIEVIGEKPTPLKKNNDVENDTPSPSSEGIDGGDSKVNKGKDKNMSEKILQELADVKKALAVSQAEKGLMKYSLDSEVEKGVAEAIASLESEAQSFIYKALDQVISKAKEDVIKQKDDENPLKKSLDEEEGHSEEQEVAKTMADKVIEARENK